MKKFFKFLLIACFSFLTLCICTEKPAQPTLRVVTGVDISCNHKDVPIRRHYTDSDKMEYVLLYLRLLQPTTTSQYEPESANADIYEITLQLLDGSHRIYRQKDHRYLCQGEGPWQAIAPEQAEGLYRLMRKLPSDHI